MEREGALQPKKENTASWPVLWPEEVPHMAVPAKLEEFHTGNAIGIVSDRRGIRAGALVAA